MHERVTAGSERLGKEPRRNHKSKHGEKRAKRIKTDVGIANYSISRMETAKQDFYSEALLNGRIAKLEPGVESGLAFRFRGRVWKKAYVTFVVRSRVRMTLGEPANCFDS